MLLPLRAHIHTDSCPVQPAWLRDGHRHGRAHDEPVVPGRLCVLGLHMGGRFGANQHFADYLVNLRLAIHELLRVKTGGLVVVALDCRSFSSMSRPYG